MANLEKTRDLSLPEKKSSGSDDFVTPPYLDSNEDLDASFRVEEKALLRKLDLRLLPALTLLYLLSFLDRSNGEFTLSSRIGDPRVVNGDDSCKCTSRRSD